MMAKLGTLAPCLGLATDLGGGCGWLLVRKMQSVVNEEVLGVGLLVEPQVARWYCVPQRR